jgi:hypothetical protein
MLQGSGQRAGGCGLSPGPESPRHPRTRFADRPSSSRAQPALPTPPQQQTAVAPTRANAAPGSRSRAQQLCRAAEPLTGPAEPSSAPPPPLDSPTSAIDVDPELWAVLSLCSDDELEALHAVLHGPSPFSPLVKSLMVSSTAAELPAAQPQALNHSPRLVCDAACLYGVLPRASHAVQGVCAPLPPAQAERDEPPLLALRGRTAVRGPSRRARPHGTRDTLQFTPLASGRSGWSQTRAGPVGGGAGHGQA